MSGSTEHTEAGNVVMTGSRRFSAIELFSGDNGQKGRYIVHGGCCNVRALSGGVGI